MAFLDVQNVSKRFEMVTAASDLNVGVAEGEILGIVGSNGAGKTVFINMITGYEKPTTGAIIFNGKDITRLLPREITKLGICRSFQMSQVFPSMTVFENVLFAHSIGQPSRSLLKVIGRPDNIESADQILERFRLVPYRDRVVRELSQGIQKLLDIALAIVGRPKVVMLDEPTSGISTEEKFNFMNLVMDALIELKVTIFVVEHDMAIIEKHVSRVLAFSQGRIICDAPPQIALHDSEVIRYVLGNNDVDG
jgi:branched-chain amino acid transport system ATP-binding protein